MVLRNISDATWAFRVLSGLTYACLTAFLIACDASNEKRGEGSSDLNPLVAVRTSFPDRPALNRDFPLMQHQEQSWYR